MSWRFSLRMLLVLVAVAALAAAIFRWYVSQPREQVERALRAIWRDTPSAAIRFDADRGHLLVEGAARLSAESARALWQAELISVVIVDSRSTLPNVPSWVHLVTTDGATKFFGSPVQMELRRGFGAFMWDSPDDPQWIIAGRVRERDLGKLSHEERMIGEHLRDELLAQPARLNPDRH